MNARLAFLAKFYGTLIATFWVGKIIFFLRNGFPAIGDAAAVFAHGLPLDLNVAAYASAPLWLGLVAAFLLPLNVQDGAGCWARRTFRVYAVVIAAFVLLALIVDTLLYAGWGFKLDAVCLSYLDNPSGTTNSVGLLPVLLGLAGFVVLTFLFARLLISYMPRPAATRPPAPSIAGRLFHGSVLLFLGGLLFLAIRGGVGKSTANVGMVYFSSRQYLNHAAVNPVFSFFYSLLKERDFSKQAQYFAPEEANRIFATLSYSTESHLLPADSLLTTSRPNVLLILMESCGGRVVGCTEGTQGVTPTLDSLAQTGVFFARCYANSFRTDRGTICTFSGYPAFPDASVMKMPAKSRVLPSLAATLRRAGYATEFLYGGDKNFTNMNSYLLATGYDRVWGDEDFPAALRKTHVWGVTDHLMFDQLARRIATTPKDRPWFKTLLTLSSHEPWEVPHQALADKHLNAFHYLDQSIGHFLTRLRQTPAWHNTLIVILPDHGVGWPTDINEFDTRKYHIPMIWTGGAVRAHRRIDQICNQTDLAATLLGQLGLPHADFRFSRDVLSQTYTHPCAFHAWPEGFTYIDSTGTTTYVLATRNVDRSTPDPEGHRLRKAQAFMQVAYRDLDALK